jgi:hypothetical protein
MTLDLPLCATKLSTRMHRGWESVVQHTTNRQKPAPRREKLTSHLTMKKALADPVRESAQGLGSLENYRVLAARKAASNARCTVACNVPSLGVLP